MLIPPPKRADAPPAYGQIRVGSTFNCNKLIRYVRPKYPKEAKGKRIRGTVHLRAVIAKTGEVRDLEVINGDPLLIPAAVSAARQWRYTPCKIDSEAVEVVADLEMNFYPEP